MTDHKPRPGYGALFRDNAKRKPTLPDYKGQIVLPDGSRVNMAGWVTEGATGKYLSLKISGDVLPPLADGEPEKEDFGADLSKTNRPGVDVGPLPHANRGPA